MNHRIFILTALSLTGCGGSGSGPGAAAPVTVVIPSTAARDGGMQGAGFYGPSLELFLGDMDGGAPGVSLRSVVGFDLGGAGIPSGATILSATLAIQQAPVSGNAYAGLGSVLVDHVDLGAAIDGTDFSGNTLLAAFGVLSTDPTPAVKTLEVGARVQADLTNGRTFSDFRLRFASDSDGDGSDDFIQFNDYENAAGIGPKPALTVTYLP